MASLLVSETDPRGPKAVALAADAGQWAKCTTRDGRKLYGIRSSDGSHYYLVSRNSCTCYDAQRHECKHMLAVRLHCDLVAEQQDAAADKLALARILGGPRPGLTKEAYV